MVSTKSFQGSARSLNPGSFSPFRRASPPAPTTFDGRLNTARSMTIPPEAEQAKLAPSPFPRRTAAECITAYNDLKLSKKYKYIIYKLSDDNKEIVVEEASADKDWENFREKLINATSKTKSGAVGKGPRYAVYDFEYSLASGEGERNKITFLAWSPDDAGVMAKMIYASSKEALKRSLTGIATELQANDADDIEYDSILKTVSKGMAG
ncbi:unnamed protein product [Colletotrichum noveboracense]|uniref:Cofilin n=1 Tax=Colletotrichum noveboracense TaxID=2664923 RepID=A0A9W4W5L2_9PEZI|nr:unnamed protein product [Colletotrichum noveboracense]